MKLMLGAIGLTLGGTLILALAQDYNTYNTAPGGPEDGNGFHHRPPPNLIFEALDANHDGVIDANEIANAPAALRKLDKNGDGQITWEEIRPPLPPYAENGPGADGHPPPLDDH